MSAHHSSSFGMVGGCLRGDKEHAFNYTGKLGGSRYISAIAWGASCLRTDCRENQDGWAVEAFASVAQSNVDHQTPSLTAKGARSQIGFSAAPLSAGPESVGPESVGPESANAEDSKVCAKRIDRESAPSRTNDGESTRNSWTKPDVIPSCSDSTEGTRKGTRASYGLPDSSSEKLCLSWSHELCCINNRLSKLVTESVTVPVLVTAQMPANLESRTGAGTREHPAVSSFSMEGNGHSSNRSRADAAQDEARESVNDRKPGENSQVQNGMINSCNDAYLNATTFIVLDGHGPGGREAAAAVEKAFDTVFSRSILLEALDNENAITEANERNDGLNGKNLSLGGERQMRRSAFTGKGERSGWDRGLCFERASMPCSGSNTRPAGDQRSELPASRGSSDEKYHSLEGKENVSSGDQKKRSKSESINSPFKEQKTERSKSTTLTTRNHTVETGRSESQAEKQLSLVTESLVLAQKTIEELNIRSARDFGTTCVTVTLVDDLLIASSCGDSTALLVLITRDETFAHTCSDEKATKSSSMSNITKTKNAANCKGDHEKNHERTKSAHDLPKDQGRSQAWIVELSRRHNLEDLSEITRIDSEGQGRVIKGDGGVLRLIPRCHPYEEAKRRGLSINMSRSMGHSIFQTHGLSVQHDFSAISLDQLHTLITTNRRKCERAFRLPPLSYSHCLKHIPALLKQSEEIHGNTVSDASRFGEANVVKSDPRTDGGKEAKRQASPVVPQNSSLRTLGDVFLVLMSDGVTDVLSSSCIVQILRQHMDRANSENRQFQPLPFASALTMVAKERRIRSRQRSDNCTCLAVHLLPHAVT